jgi:hypothetical protein
MLARRVHDKKHRPRTVGRQLALAPMKRKGLLMTRAMRIRTTAVAGAVAVLAVVALLTVPATQTEADSAWTPNAVTPAAAPAAAASAAPLDSTWTG